MRLMRRFLNVYISGNFCFVSRRYFLAALTHAYESANNNFLDDLHFMASRYIADKLFMMSLALTLIILLTTYATVRCQPCFL